MDLQDIKPIVGRSQVRWGGAASQGCSDVREGGCGALDDGMVGASLNDLKETAVRLRFSKETFQGTSNDGFQLSGVLYSRLGRHKEEHRAI